VQKIKSILKQNKEHEKKIPCQKTLKKQTDNENRRTTKIDETKTDFGTPEFTIAYLGLALTRFWHKGIIKQF